MPEIDLVALRTAAQEFSRQHLKECCAEMVELANTGVLPHGKVRELATLCAAFAGHDGLKVAEGMVKHEAMVRVAGMSADEVLVLDEAMGKGSEPPATRGVAEMSLEMTGYTTPGGASLRKLPPRGQPVELERWGKAAPDSGLLLQRQLDGYWTPWHIAQAALDAARGAQAPRVTEEQVVAARNVCWARKGDYSPSDAVIREMLEAAFPVKEGGAC